MARMSDSTAGERGGSSQTNSGRGPFAWCSTKARRSGRWPAISISRRRRWPMGSTRASGSGEGPDRPDHRGARRAGPPPQRESRAADGARHPKKSRGLFRQAPGVVFAWIEAEKAEFSIAQCCQALQVSPSGFYAWQHRPESTHAQTDRQLRVLIRASLEESRRALGSPRVHEDLIEQAVRSAGSASRG